MSSYKECLRNITRRYAQDYIEAEIFLEMFGFYDEDPIYKSKNPINNDVFDEGISAIAKPKKKKSKKCKLQSDPDHPPL
jgi:hypothetical protein